MIELKKRPSNGRRLGRLGGFAGRTAPANLLLKRGHAASNNETDIPVSIFPTLCFLTLKTVLPASFPRIDDACRLKSSDDQHVFHVSNEAEVSREVLEIFQYSDAREYEVSSKSLAIRSAYAR